MYVWLCGSGLPGADAVQAPELLARGGKVEALAAFGEVAGDGGAVLDGLVVVVLELGLNVGDLQAQAADAGQHPAIRGPADGDERVVAVRLEVGELAAQEFGLVLGVVDDEGAAGELDGGVVAGGDASLGAVPASARQGPGTKA